MKKQDKTIAIDQLKEKFSNNTYFYFTDSSTLTVEQVNKLRGLCYEKGIEMKVVKNTLARKALENISEDSTTYDSLYDILKGPTTVMFTDVANAPAKLIKEFRKEFSRPLLKAAYIDSAIFIGEEQLDTLATLKSKEELIGDVILLLQSPMKNLISSLKSGQNTISGLLKALENRAEQE